MRLRLLFSALAVGALAGAALAQNPPGFGPKFGVYFPTSTAAKDAFGDTWVSFGIGAVGREGFRERTSIVYDFNILSRNANGNRLFALSPSVGYRFAFAGEDDSAIPYVAVRAGLSYFDYAIGSGVERQAATQLGFNGNTEFGIQFEDRLTVFVRYDVFTNAGMFNFNGFTLAANYAIVRF